MIFFQEMVDIQRKLLFVFRIKCHRLKCHRPVRELPKIYHMQGIILDLGQVLGIFFPGLL